VFFFHYFILFELIEGLKIILDIKIIVKIIEHIIIINISHSIEYMSEPNLFFLVFCLKIIKRIKRDKLKINNNIFLLFFIFSLDLIDKIKI